MKTLTSDVSASLFYRVALRQRLQAQIDSAARSVNDDRLGVDGDKNMRLLAFAFTIVFVWT